MTVVEATIEDAEDLHLGIIRYFDSEERHQRDTPSVANLLTVWGLPSLDDFIVRIHTPDEEGESFVWEAIAPLDRDHVGRAVWAAMACDFGSLLPMSPGFIYILSPSLGLRCHPYDDRGMVVSGLSRHVLQRLYTKHNDWLLDYNRAKMDDLFAL